MTDVSTASPAAIVLDDVRVSYQATMERARGVDAIVKYGGRSRQTNDIHALRGITATIGVGEAVGVIGNNGSGKSTLMQAIAGLTPISSGRLLVRGEARMLGVGAVLKKQLSGARNIYIGGLALGMRRSDVDALFDSIVAESGLNDAILRPVRTYSSGMKARLQFAIATAVVPDVLLIDEVLAVGDRRFRRRSLNRLREVKESAGTILLVTHRFGEIETTCDRTMWLDDGQVVADGPTPEVLASYREAQDTEDD